MEPDCQAIIAECWESARNAGIRIKIARCSEQLGRWGEDIHKKFKSEIAKCRDSIKHLKSNLDASSEEVIQARAKLDRCLAQEEEWWKQRAKVFWLQSGNANTKVFHHYASSRKKKNQILQLLDDHDNVCSWDNGIPYLIYSYFSNMFQSNGGSGEAVIANVQSRVSADQNTHLESLYTASEIECAIKGMHTDKSPSQDGMNPGFFQKHWDIVGASLVDSCLMFLNEGFLPNGINDTLICLISKEEEPGENGRFASYLTVQCHL